MWSSSSVRTLVVTDAADELALLTTAELREAAGVTGSSQDSTLAAMGLRIAALITTECNVAVGNGAPPTLRQETLTETFWNVRTDQLVLSRRFEIAVDTLTEDDVAMTEGTDFLVDPESGILTRMYSNCPGSWCAQKIVVVYDAGFATVPRDLAQAAMDFVKVQWDQQTRDPTLKSEVIDIPDVERTEKTWWVSSTPSQSIGTIPDPISSQITRFRSPAIG
jgi:hypothetical protein